MRAVYSVCLAVCVLREGGNRTKLPTVPAGVALHIVRGVSVEDKRMKKLPKCSKMFHGF